MKTLIILVFLCQALISTGQIDNMDLVLHQPLMFSFNTYDDLTQPMVLNKAVELKLRADGFASTVSAFIDFANVNSPDFLNSIKLVPSGSSSGSVTYANSEFLLNQTPTLLFTQAPVATPQQDHNFFFDVVILPPSTFVLEPQHSFLLTFTHTITGQ